MEAQEVTDVKRLEIEQGLNDRIVNRVIRGSKGFFYVFQNQSIQRFDGKNFENVHLKSDIKVSLDQINQVRLDSLGIILANFNDSALQLQIESASLQATLHSETKKVTNAQILKPEEIKLLEIDTHGILFKNQGVHYLAAQGTIWKQTNEEHENINAPSIYGLNPVFSKKDKEGNQIFFYGQRKRTIERILVMNKSGEIVDFSNILAYNDNIKDLYADDIFSKWMLATYNGLIMINFTDANIKNYQVIPGLNKSQFGNIITAINASNDKIIYTKESYGMYQLMEDGTGQILFLDRPELFHHNQKISYDPEEDIYYSHSYRYDGKTDLQIFNGDCTEVEVVVIDLKLNHLFDIEGADILLSGFKEGLDKKTAGVVQKYNAKSKKIQTVINDIPLIRSILKVKQNKEYWISTLHGIYIYDYDFQFKIKITNEVETDPGYIEQPHIILCKTYNNKILAGSLGDGIYIIDPSTKTVIGNLNAANGLSDNLIVGFVEDEVGNMWISTFNGLNVVSTELKILRRFYEYNGLPNREFNSEACASDNNGNLYFGTLNGLVKIDSKKLLRSKNSNGLHISQISAFKKDGKGLNKKIPIENQYAFSYNDFDSINVHIEFPDYYKYRFDNPIEQIKISGFEKKNLYLKNDHIQLPSLPPSEYRLSINNRFNEASDLLELKVERNYKKGINSIFLLLGMIGVIGLISKYRIAKLTKIEKEKTITNKKIAQLELTALRSQMNPHFIFNALGAIQYFVQTQKTELADKYLSDFAMLMRMILESSQTKYISLSEEIKLLELYIGLEKVRFEEMFDFEINIEDAVDQENPIPPMILQPFIENAINHGLYNLKDRKGKLTITISAIGENSMLCSIKDNGVGRVEAAKLKRKNHKSRGLQIVNERINTINSQAEQKIDIKTIDLQENGQALGTEILIKFDYNV